MNLLNTIEHLPSVAHNKYSYKIYRKPSRRIPIGYDIYYMIYGIWSCPKCWQHFPYRVLKEQTVIRHKPVRGLWLKVLMQQKIQFNRNPFISKRFWNVKDWHLQLFCTSLLSWDIDVCLICKYNVLLMMSHCIMSCWKDFWMTQSLTFLNLFEMNGFLLNWIFRCISTLI